MLQDFRRAAPWLWGLALLAVVAAPAAAQVHVQGEVLDGASGKPVRGVIVQLPLLGLATLTDSLGYFEFASVPAGDQVISTYHFGYEALTAETPIVAGEILALNLTPRPVSLSGVAVDVRPSEEIEALTVGRAADYIGPEQIEEMEGRTNKLLEVMRMKAPPRLRIRQKGNGVNMTFCIESSRRRPSIQELRDLGTGCHPALIVLDGAVIYAPPSNREFGIGQPPTLPADVAAILLNQRPEEIESIRVLTAADAFFRYGDAGRLGAVEIVTKRPENALRRKR